MDMNTNSIGIDETTVPVIESFTQIEIANKIGITAVRRKILRQYFNY